MYTHLVFHAVAQSAFTNKMARVKLHSSVGSVMERLQLIGIRIQITM